MRRGLMAWDSAEVPASALADRLSRLRAELAREGFESEEITDLAGLNQRSPLYAGVMAICLFSLAGVPPMVGFYAKLSVLQALIASGQTGSIADLYRHYGLDANAMEDGVHIRLTLTRGVKVTSGMDPRLNQSGPTLIVLAELLGSVIATLR